jgi:hypothetical protein
LGAHGIRQLSGRDVDELHILANLQTGCTHGFLCVLVRGDAE